MVGCWAWGSFRVSNNSGSYLRPHVHEFGASAHAQIDIRAALTRDSRPYASFRVPLELIMKRECGDELAEQVLAVIEKLLSCGQQYLAQIGLCGQRLQRQGGSLAGLGAGRRPQRQGGSPARLGRGCWPQQQGGSPALLWVGPRGPLNCYVRPGPPASAATPAMVRAVGEAAQGGQPGCWRPVACGGGRPRLGAVAWPAGTRLGPVGPGVGYMHPLSGVFSRLRTSLSSLRRDRAFNVLLRAR